MIPDPNVNQAHIQRFEGLANVYDRYRPHPPAVLIDILCQLAEVARPHLVVDIGSGTGLSTVLWADHADEVIGVEPGDDMRTQAEHRTAQQGATNVHYIAGTSSATTLPDGCADIVTISQALHWMEPTSTFAEVARILRPGGIFAAYDCDWPPVVRWEVDAAYAACQEQANAAEHEHAIASHIHRWRKEEHLGRIAASGRFRFVSELAVHQREDGDVERLLGVMRSQGGIANLLGHGLTEAEIGLVTLREVAERVLGTTSWPWYWTYRVRMGVR